MGICLFLYCRLITLIFLIFCLQCLNGEYLNLETFYYNYKTGNCIPESCINLLIGCSVTFRLPYWNLVYFTKCPAVHPSVHPFLRPSVHSLIRSFVRPSVRPSDSDTCGSILPSLLFQINANARILPALMHNTSWASNRFNNVHQSLYDKTSFLPLHSAWTSPELLPRLRSCHEYHLYLSSIFAILSGRLYVWHRLWLTMSCHLWFNSALMLKIL